MDEPVRFQRLQVALGVRSVDQSVATRTDRLIAELARLNERVGEVLAVA